MILFPALKISNRVIKGRRDDSHNSLGSSIGISKPTEDSRGFTPDGKLFLSRTQALGFLKKHDRKTYNELPQSAQSGLHSEDLAIAYGIEQSDKAKSMRGDYVVPTKTTPKITPVDLSTKTVLIYDRGLYLYIAEKLAKTYKKVYYHIPQSDPYPCSNLHNIGTGIKNVERCFDFWGTLDKCDLVMFPDCYDGNLQEFLRGKGYLVFGSGHGERIETDKIFFMETLEKVGLPIARTYLAEGIEDLKNYLSKEKGEKWLKGLTRGDFETKRYRDMDHLQPFLDDLKHRLGKRVDTIEILVQDPVDSEVEVGYDGFQVDGQFTKNCLVGYEVKDRGFVASVVEEPCDIVKHVNDKMASTFKRLGYRGAYSTEIRVDKKGVGYFIDPTCRFGSPPGELMSEIYSNYPEIIWEIANGRVPLPEPKAKYGAQMILTSEWYREEHETYVEFPSKYKDHIKLSNYYVSDGKTFIVPNETDEYFGSVVATGNTVEEATCKVMEILEEVRVEKLKYDEEIFEEANEAIEAGKKFGVEF